MPKVKKAETDFDRLARMMQAEFSGLHKEFEKVYGILQLHNDRFERVEADIHDIKTSIGPLVRIMSLRDQQVESMEIRLRQVERKVGISK